MFDFLNKVPFEGFRTYFMIIAAAVVSLMPEIEILMSEADTMSTTEFSWAALKILLAILGMIYRKLGKDNQV